MTRAALCVLTSALGCAIPVGVGTLDDGTTSVLPESTTDTGTSSSTTVTPPDTETETDTGIVERRELAFREGDIPPTGDDDSTSAGSSVGTSGGSDIDPDALRIVIGTSEITCDDFYADMPCGRWELTFSLPPELQIAGATGDLEANLGLWLERLPGAEPDCGGGGGTLTGTFEITGIDATEVRGRLRDLGVTFDGAPTELDFTALRCG